MKRLLMCISAIVLVAIMTKVHAESVNKGSIITLSIGNVSYNHIYIEPAWAIETPEVLELVGGQGTTSVRVKGIAAGTGRVFCFYATEKYDTDLKMWVVDQKETKYFTVTVVDSGGGGGSESGDNSGDVEVDHNITLYVGEEFDCHITLPQEVEDYYGHVDRYYSSDSKCKASWTYDSNYLERISWTTDMTHYGFKALSPTSKTYVTAKYATRTLDNMGNRKYTNRVEKWGFNIQTLDVTPESISASEETLVLYCGESVYIDATILPQGAPQHFIWRNYNTDIVTMVSQYQVGAGKNIDGHQEFYTQNGGIYIVANDETVGEARILVDAPFPNVAFKEIIIKVIKEPSIDVNANGDIVITDYTAECVEMKFKVISTEDKTCQVGTEEKVGRTSWATAVPESTEGTITIPQNVNDYIVTRIGQRAFNGCSGLTGINIPNSVTSIGNGAFYGCTGLTSITIPNSVTSIEGSVFSNCTGLTSITIPNSVTSIGKWVFNKCSDLTSIVVEQGNEKYDSRDGCNAIVETITNTLKYGCKNTVIPNSVTSIGEYAFYGRTSLISITIPNSVTGIENSAFGNCSGLTSVIVDIKTPLEITSSTFSDCTNATLYVPYGCKAAYEAADYWNEFKEIIEIPKIIEFADANVKALCIANWDTDGDGELSEAEAAAVSSLGEVFKENTTITSFNELEYFTGLTSINDNAFRECTSLTSIAIPRGVTAIEICAFYGCNNLETVSIPEGVSSISGYAFMGCSSLVSLMLPNSVTSIGYDAFNGCSSLSSINIPENVTLIDNETFYGCSSLTSIVIPAGVTSLGASTFFGCISLKTVDIPDGVKIIGRCLFYGCSSLTSIDIPYDVRIIGERAFEGCSSLTSINIPSLVNTIGALAFAGCNNLSMVTVENNTPIEITEDVFSNRTNATLYVPAGCKAAYKAANYWKEFKEIVDPEAEDTDISALDNTIYINKVEVYAGTETTLSIQMKNTAAIRGFQFDLYLPEGVKVVKNDKGRIQAALDESRMATDDEHTLTCSEQEDGAVRFLCGSQYEETFTGNDGEIATLQVVINSNMDEGDYPLLLKDIKLSESDISKYYEVPLVKTTLTVSSYMPGDINADGKVDVSDYIGVANHILGHTPEGFVKPAGDVDNSGVIDVSDYLGIGNIIHTGSVYGSNKVMKKTNRASDIATMDNVIYVGNVTVNAGSTATLSLCMKNSAAIRGFQFDLYLPAGITAAVNSKGRIQAALTNGRLDEGDEHTLTTSQQEDGGIRFLCGSQYEETFTGNDGEIATLTVNVDAEMFAGEYSVFLKNMKLSENDIRNYYETELVESTINVDSSPTGIDKLSIARANSPINSYYYNLAGQRLAQPTKGLYIVNGKKVVIK